MEPGITLIGAVFSGGDGRWRLMHGLSGRRNVGCSTGGGGDGRSTVGVFSSDHLMDAEAMETIAAAAQMPA